MAKVNKRPKPSSDTPMLLKNWVEKEMKILPLEKNDGQQLYQELCRGQMGDVWRFIMEHVKSKENVQHIRGNLKYKESQMEQEKHQESVSSLQDLKSEMTQTVAAIDSAQRNVQQSKTDIEEKEKLNFKLNAKLEKNLQDQRLIGDFLVDSEQIESKLRSFNHQLELIARETQELVRQQIAEKEKIYFPTGAIDEVGFNLETACSRNVNECIRPIHHNLSKIINGDFGTTPFILYDSKRALKNDIIECREKNCASDLLKCVVDVIRTNRQLFKENRFSTSHGCCVDQKMAALGSLANNTCVENSKSEAFSYQACVASELENALLVPQRSKNVTEMEKELHTIQQSISDYLNRKLENKNALLLARELVDSQLKLCAAEASTQFLSKMQSEMEAAAEYGIEIEHQLSKTGLQMLDCDSSLDKKKDTIKLLWQHNNNLLSKLETQQTENKKFVQNVLRSQVEGIGKSCSVLHGYIFAEVQAFNQIPLTPLTVLDVNGCQKLQRSLSVYNGNQGRSDLTRLYKALDLDYYKSPEHILSQVIQRRDEADYLRNTMRLYENFLSDVQSLGDVTPSKNTSELISRLEKTYQNKQSIVQELTVTEKEGASGLKICDGIQNSIAIWSELPAKNIDVAALERTIQCK